MKKTRISDYFLNDVQVFQGPVSTENFPEYISNFDGVSRFLEGIGHQFANFNLFVKAITHRSFAHEVKFPCEHNEKLEFLGDSVLQLVISQKLYELYPNLQEGVLSKLRSSIVNETSLSKVARALELDGLILLGRGEFNEEGYLKPSLLANLFEAILGAIYLDSNLKKVEQIIERVLTVYKIFSGVDLLSIEYLDEFDAKSKLQEECLKFHKTLPVYESQEKKVNNQVVFKITLKIKNKEIASLEDISKKKGMQKLAKLVLEKNLHQSIKES